MIKSRRDEEDIIVNTNNVNQMIIVGEGEYGPPKVTERVT